MYSLYFMVNKTNTFRSQQTTKQYHQNKSIHISSNALYLWETRPTKARTIKIRR